MPRPSPAPEPGKTWAAGPPRPGTAEAPQVFGGLPPRPVVLLIEDDPGDALLVEELLADSGIAAELRWAKSLAQAQVELAAAVPHCVLLDLHLPDASGIPALHQIVQRAHGAAVVVLTGLAEADIGTAAVAAGAQDYLVKGQVDGDLLGRAIRYAIGRKQTEQSAVAWQSGQLRAAENARLERGLLPTPLLRDSAVQVVARYQPGRAHALLGGDFYDVVQTRDGAVHAVVGDVSGHGPDEAALGVCLRVAWRSFVLAGVRGSALVELLEQILVAERSGPEIFATLTSLRRAPGADHAQVIRAGHPGLLIREAGAVASTEPPGGPAIGFLPGAAAWHDTSVRAPAGGALVLFTDGLIEGYTGAGHERLGETGLLEIARRHASLPPDAFLDALIAAAQRLAAPRGGLLDDVAVLHLEWSATA